MAHDIAGTPTRSAARDRRSSQPTGTLVGRTDELRQLESFWQDTIQGRAQAVLVRGDAGVGKTRLMAEFGTLVERRGAVVATARSFGTSGRLALAPVAEWLRQPALRSAARQLNQVWRTEIERLVPSGEEPVDRPAGANAVADSWQRHRFFEALARAVTAPGRPTLLVLDNIQWSDPETLTFVAFLLGFAPRAPLMVAGTLRSERQLDLELTRWASRIRTAGLLTELTVAPLDTADTRRLAERVSGRAMSDQGAAVLYATTDGLPLYVVEAARAPADDKATVRGHDFSDVLQERFRQCSPPAQEIVALAAAVGRDFTLDLLIEASDLAAEDVVQAVDELWQRRILLERGDGYDFSHDLVREAAYESISPPRRWLQHRRLGQSLELLHADALDDVAAELAEQYALGGRTEHAVQYYIRAARAAAAVFAYAEAIRLLRRAIALITTRSARINHGSLELDCLEAMIAPLAAVYGYASTELQEASERCVALAEKLGRPRVAVNAMIALWVSRIVRGRLLDARDLAGQARVRCEPGDNRWSHVQFIGAGSAAMLARSAEAVEQFRLAWEHPGGTEPLAVGARPDVQARSWAAHTCWLIGRPDEAQSLTTAAIDLARSIGQPFTLVVALAYAAITHQLAGDRPALLRTATELAGLIDRYSFPYFGEWGMITEGWGRGGEPGLAIALRGVNNLKAKGAFLRMPYWLSLVAELYRQAGRPEAARGALDAALAGGQARSEMWWLPEILRLRAAYDDPGPAIARLRSAAQLARNHGSVALQQRCETDLTALQQRG
jgi:tetratricopeptide (TPR) repeat protein